LADSSRDGGEARGLEKLSSAQVLTHFSPPDVVVM
jgi:hypothetical protein